jgi:hypothetical protein
MRGNEKHNATTDFWKRNPTRQLYPAKAALSGQVRGTTDRTIAMPAICRGAPSEDPIDGKVLPALGFTPGCAALTDGRLEINLFAGQLAVDGIGDDVAGAGSAHGTAKAPPIIMRRLMPCDLAIGCMGAQARRRIQRIGGAATVGSRRAHRCGGTSRIV